MKIAIIGYSGSGKSTLARRLGERYGVEVLHFDRVQSIKTATTTHFSRCSFLITGNAGD